MGQEMYMDGWITEKLDTLIDSGHDRDCEAEVEERNSHNGPKGLDLDRMGGIFCLHFGFSFLAIVGHFVLHDYRKKRSYTSLAPSEDSRPYESTDSRESRAQSREQSRA